jgi:divalent metal cation (Fe/Co/Zn/Cd) transporter
MEPLGIIVFAVVITTSFSQVLLSSIERLTEANSETELVELSPMALALLAANIIIKGLLWLWCSTVKGSSSVQALAQDHENDVVFNIASTIFPVVGKCILSRIKVIKGLFTIIILAVWAGLAWLDPVGAIILSIYIIYEWITVMIGT